MHWKIVRHSAVIANAVESAIGYLKSPEDDLSSDARHWFSMYQAQCHATDAFGKLAEERSDAALLAQIKTLQKDLALMNARYVAASTGMSLEEKKLVAFFKSGEGDSLGREGDHDNLTPAETAIRAMRKLIAKESECQP